MPTYHASFMTILISDFLQCKENPMAKDKNVNIKIKADSKDANSAIDKVSSKLNELKKRLSKNKTANLVTSLSGIAKAFSLATSGIKKAAAAIKDLNDTALVQIKAETQLEAAAKNNPYLNRENIKQLKSYASELQGIGTIGDEQLLPLMAQLAAAGRTQAEIQDIMSAALDVSASGAMSMESAVKNLNKTFSGLSGELGESVPQIKSLTKEQLQNGEAVKIIARQYEGMAKETAKATGSGIQLSNAFGDLKEQLGMGFTAIIRPVNVLFTNLITKVGNAIGKVNELLGFAHEQTAATAKPSDIAADELTKLKDQRESLNSQLLALEAQYNAALEKEQKKGVSERAKNIEDANRKWEEEQRKTAEANIAEEKARIEESLKLIEFYGSQKKKAEAALATPGISSAEKKKAQKDIKDYDKSIKAQQKVIDASEEYIANNKAVLERTKNMLDLDTSTSEGFKRQIDELKKQSDELGQKIQDKQKEMESLQKTEKNSGGSEKDIKAAELIKSNTDELNKNISAIKAKADAMRSMGQDVDEAATQQEIVNAVEQSYIDLVTKDTSLVSTSNAAAKERLKKLDEEKEKLALIIGLKKDPAAAKELVLKWAAESKTELEKMRDELARLELLKEQISSGAISIDVDISQVDTAIEKLKESISGENMSQIAGNISNVLGTLSSGLNNISTYFNSAMESRLSDVQKESEEEADSLRMQYDEGLISYDEYCQKKDELDKKAAQKEYKIKLAQWAMDLAMANVSAAQAVANALASGTPPVNILNAVAAGALGAAQVATVMGSKPAAPSFSTGGFLTGNSTSGDKIPFKGNAGEAILNPAEQRNFMRLANGEGTSAPVTVNMPVTIENNAANDVSVSAENDYNRVKITVDKIVNAGLRSGVYNEGLSAANSSMKGAKYL